ncbi:MAG: hypothetical protein JWM59_4695 [Verrucomicrobiales bacterium]|nr:hypothetical protein [Verrucomicrobiales bacterium]
MAAFTLLSVKLPLPVPCFLLLLSLGAPELPAQEKQLTAPPAAPAPASPAKPAPPAGSIPTPASEPDPARAIKKLDGNRYELNGILFDKKTRAIVIPAKVNMNEGLLEYALVHEAGKVHESLLSTAVSPFDLNVVLLLLNYQECAGFFDQSNKQAGAMPVKNPKIDPTAQLMATVEWKAPDNSAKSARLESLLLNIDKKSTVTEGPFTYTGSLLMQDGTFLAKDTGSILALYADVAAVINNPRGGNENDDIWVPDKTKVPDRDTPVTVILQPYAAAKPAPKPQAAPKSPVKK